MSDHEYLQTVSPDRLAGLIFELAAQLHVERAHRMALERALTEAGVLAEGAVLDPGPQAAAALDRSVRALLRVVTESGDNQVPLRAEALGAPDQA
jgi:hypothetical protein